MDFGTITRFFSNLCRHVVDGTRSRWGYKTCRGVEVNVSPLAGEVLTLGAEGVVIELCRTGPIAMALKDVAWFAARTSESASVSAPC
jgi:hypothetical protein